MNGFVLEDEVKRVTKLDQPPKHKWIPGDPWRLCGAPESKISRELGRLSARAVVMMASGFAEWIAWRLDRHCGDRALFNNIEAVRASVVDWTYLRDKRDKKIQLKGSKWSGPLCGPIWLGVSCLNSSADAARRGMAASVSAGYLYHVALQVVGSPKPFKDWYSVIYKRFLKFHRYKRENPLGAIVPPEALVPSAVDSDNEQQLQRFLTSLNYKTNPFLNSPSEMKAAGFKGTPYTLR